MSTISDPGQARADAQAPGLGALDRLPRVRLAHLPTPLEPLVRLGAQAGADIWIKRDDCTGLAFGGNKTRKLEYAIAHAIAQGADTLIATSGFQSNFVRQTAAAAARLGLEFHGVIAEPAPGRAAHYFTSGNLLLDHLLGATLHTVADEGPAMEAKVAELSQLLRGRGRTPVRLLRGDNDAAAALGYVNCAQELLEQCDAAGFTPGAIFIVVGGGSGQAGLLTGLRLLGSPARVVGISCSEPSEVKRSKVKALIPPLLGQLGVQVDIPDEEIEVRDAYTGGAYAVPTEGANQAIRRTALAEGVILDPIYTGKGMAGLLDMVATGAVDTSEPIVFVHSGGLPALFVYDDLFWGGVSRAP